MFGVILVGCCICERHEFYMAFSSLLVQPKNTHLGLGIILRHIPEELHFKWYLHLRQRTPPTCHAHNHRSNEIPPMT